jgi:hypothetical protein
MVVWNHHQLPTNNTAVMSKILLRLLGLILILALAFLWIMLNAKPAILGKNNCIISVRTLSTGFHKIVAFFNAEGRKVNARVRRVFQDFIRYGFTPDVN